MLTPMLYREKQQQQKVLFYLNKQTQVYSLYISSQASLKFPPYSPLIFSSCQIPFLQEIYDYSITNRICYFVFQYFFLTL